MTPQEELRDYADSGLDIQYAFDDMARRHPDLRTRPPYILWGGPRVFTADRLEVPAAGRVRGALLSRKGDVQQGFDLRVDGWIELAGGERVPLLRTWDDPRYEPEVEYPYSAPDGALWTWNVFMRPDARGGEISEKWTGNAGFWIEEVGPVDRVYHCSHGLLETPDFESFITG